MQFFPLLISRAGQPAPAAADGLHRHNLRAFRRIITQRPSYIPSCRAGVRQEKTDRPPGLPRGSWLMYCSRDFCPPGVTGRVDPDNRMKQVYYNEGWRSASKYTFEVYQLENGTYQALVRKWNGKINKVMQESQFLSETREALRHHDYPRTRQVQIFLNSDFWEKGDD